MDYTAKEVEENGLSFSLVCLCFALRQNGKRCIVLVIWKYLKELSKLLIQIGLYLKALLLSYNSPL